MSRTVGWLGAGLLILAAFTRPSMAEEPWVVFSDANFPPYAYVEKGKPTGMDTEIVEAVLAEAGVVADHRQVPWSRALVSLNSGLADFAYQLVGLPERFERYHMVGPIRSGLTVFAVRAESHMEIRSLKDLEGLTVGTAMGFSYTPEFDAATHFQKEAAASVELSLRMLAAGRVDAVIGDRVALGWLVRQEGLSGRIRFLEPPLSEVPRYVAFPKNRADKARRFAAALEKLKADGTIDAIVARWRDGRME